MSNQRSGSKHAARLSDSFNISLRALIQYGKDAQAALEEAGETDGALYWEMFVTFLQEDVATGKKQFRFDGIQFGL